MNGLHIGEVLVGIVLVAGGGWKMWQTRAQLRDLEEKEANLRRYDAWRGGRRAVPEGPSEAEILATDLRRGIGIWGSLAVLGLILVLLGLLAG